MSALKKDKKVERLHMRVSKADKSLIEDALSFKNIGLSEFILEDLINKSKDVLKIKEELTLEEKAWKGFTELLASPKPASENLKSAMAKYFKDEGE